MLYRFVSNRIHSIDIRDFHLTSKLRVQCIGYHQESILIINNPAFTSLNLMLKDLIEQALARLL